jgi:phage anti-repressor protein
MLQNYGGAFPYRMTELYKVLGLKDSNYNRWVKSNLLENMFEDGTDYKTVLFTMKSTPKGGQLRKEYELTRRTVEELAILARTKEGRILRTWLLDLKDAVENYDYLSLDQVYFMIDLVYAFSFVNNQVAAEKTHLQMFVDSRGGVATERICQQFHIERNKALKFSKDDLEIRIKRYYDEENKLVNKTRKRDILAVINHFELIGHAAFDFMKTVGKPSEMALKVGEIVTEIASRSNAQIRPANEVDLFNDKINLNPVITNRLAPKLLS